MIFSIIIPAKNEEKNIVKCLSGIKSLNFSNKDFEIIVVDNNSTDNTGKIARDAGAKVIKIQTGTIGALRNQGAKLATGEFLAFIDADCVPDKDWLKNAFLVFSSQNVAAVGSKPGIPTKTTWVERTWSLMKQIPYRCETTWLSSSNFIVRKSIFEDEKGFDPSLVTCEDADIGYRISKKFTIINDPKVNVIHLGEPKTLKEFFIKEMWHGEANFKGVFRHGFTFQELPSLVFPLITATSLLFGIIGLFTLSNKFLILSFLFFLLPPCAQTAKVIKRNGFSDNIFKIFLLFIVYSLARVFAVIRMKKKK